MSYLTQQRRLVPSLASVYAYHFGMQELKVPPLPLFYKMEACLPLCYILVLFNPANENQTSGVGCNIWLSPPLLVD